MEWYYVVLIILGFLLIGIIIYYIATRYSGHKQLVHANTLPVEDIQDVQPKVTFTIDEKQKVLLPLNFEQHEFQDREHNVVANQPEWMYSVVPFSKMEISNPDSSLFGGSTVHEVSLHDENSASLHGLLGKRRASHSPLSVPRDTKKGYFGNKIITEEQTPLIDPHVESIWDPLFQPDPYEFDWSQPVPIGVPLSGIIVRVSLVQPPLYVYLPQMIHLLRAELGPNVHEDGNAIMLPTRTPGKYYAIPIVDNTHYNTRYSHDIDFTYKNKDFDIPVYIPNIEGFYYPGVPT